MQGRPLNELKWALKWKCEMCKRFEILFAGRFLSEFFTSSIGFSIVFRPSSITMTNEHLGHLASVFCCYWKSNELYNTVAIYFYLYRNAPVSLRLFFFDFFFYFDTDCGNRTRFWAWPDGIVYLLVLFRMCVAKNNFNFVIAAAGRSIDSRKS